MDPRIAALKSTSFSGRRLTRQQIADVQETVTLLPNESRNELCKTICEHLNWVTAKGDYKIGACMGMLEHLEHHGIVRLPPKRQAMARSAASRPVWTAETDEQPAIAVPLSALQPLRLEPVLDTAGRQLWNGLVDRHHYLGYKRPFGAHIRYFLVDRTGRRLGCLLFEAATRTLPCRDRWIGWHARARDRNRHLLVVNSRYLLFPWVTVKNLASCALGLAARQLSDDWDRLHKCRPVLCETFVDETRFNAVCYRAANWQRIGETRHTGKARKGVYVLPLAQACRDVLRGAQPPQTATRPLTTAQKGRAGAKDRRFSRQWEGLIAAATAVAAREDARWQKRRRVFNSLLIMLFVFRLVLAPRRQSYRITLCELWEYCRDAGIALPQEHPPAASSISEARAKLDPDVFRTVHREVLAHMDTDPLWKGHRIFAVDGSRFTLPRELTRDGYRTANADTQYPQAMVSALYRLSARIPVDFGLFAHDDERRAALTHLQHVREGDVIVYDRGYFSFDMLTAHRERGLHAVFRIPGNANPTFDAFIASQETDRVLDLAPPRKAAHLPACPVRLVKYSVAETDYCLATSLHDSQRYSIRMLADLYHGRWSIEELYKTSKTLITEFHARSERGIRQELYAMFTLVAVTRIFTNRCDSDIKGDAIDDQPDMRTNLINGARLVGREVERLFLRHSEMIAESVTRIITGLSYCLQRERPGRSYPRLSRKPGTKWRKHKAA